MITLRHHLLTIVAVFLALAAGIVLGGGPLSDVAPTVATSASEDRDAEPVEDGAQAEYTESFVSALGPATVGGRLAERSVAMVTVPGADEQVVAALTDQVSAAGGTVSARYDLSEDLVDPSQKSLVDTLGSQLLTQQAEGDVAADASTYDRIGQLLGIAVATKEAEGLDVNGKARAIVDAVTGAGLMAEPGEVAQRSPLVLVVLGTDAAGDVTAEPGAANSGVETGPVVKPHIPNTAIEPTLSRANREALFMMPLRELRHRNTRARAGAASTANLARGQRGSQPKV